MYNLDGTAIQEIKRLVQNADPVIIPHGEQTGVYYLRGADGTLTRYQAELNEGSATVFDLDSFIAAATDEGGAAQAIFVSDSQAVMVCENGTSTHRWQITLPLPTHPAYALISEWKRPTLLSQKELVRTLRTQLSRYVDATVIPTFSSLRLTSSSDGTSSVAPASTAIDRRIVKQVQADQGRDVPEYILFTPPVFDIPEDRDQTYEIKVYVEFDHDEEKFVLVAVSDDLRSAREVAVARIITVLREKFQPSMPVLYGQPK